MFKAGDKVRLVDAGYHKGSSLTNKGYETVLDHTGTIVSDPYRYGNDDELVQVDFDNGETMHCYVWRLEKVSALSSRAQLFLKDKRFSSHNGPATWIVTTTIQEDETCVGTCSNVAWVDWTDQMSGEAHIVEYGDSISEVLTKIGKNLESKGW